MVLGLPYIINGCLVYVEDIRKHYLTAKAYGAVILSEIEEGSPGMRYRAESRKGIAGCSSSDAETRIKALANNKMSREAEILRVAIDGRQLKHSCKQPCIDVRSFI